MSRKLKWNDIKPGMELVCDSWQGSVKLRVNGMYGNMAIVSMMDDQRRKPFILKESQDLRLRKLSFWDRLTA